MTIQEQLTLLTRAIETMNEALLAINTKLGKVVKSDWGPSTLPEGAGEYTSHSTKVWPPPKSTGVPEAMANAATFGVHRPLTSGKWGGSVGWYTPPAKPATVIGHEAVLSACARHEKDKPTDPCWEVVEAKEITGPCTQIIGYQVRWSEADSEERYLWVGHYFSDGHLGSPSIAWCEHAAERHAERFNKEKRAPWESRYYRSSPPENEVQDNTQILAEGDRQ